MSSFQEFIEAVAGEIGVSPPPVAADGDSIFELDGALRLGLRPVPGEDAAGIAWAEIAPPASSDDESEKRAADFLRLHFARLPSIPAIVAARDERGCLVLHARVECGNRADALSGVASLLNEAEAVRRGLDGAQGGTARTGMGGIPLPDMKGWSWR